MNDYNIYDNGSVPPFNLFKSALKFFKFFVILSIIIGIVLLITILTNPEGVGEFMGKIVNGFTNTIK